MCKPHLEETCFIAILKIEAIFKIILSLLGWGEFFSEPHEVCDEAGYDDPGPLHPKLASCMEQPFSLMHIHLCTSAVCIAKHFCKIAQFVIYLLMALLWHVCDSKLKGRRSQRHHAWAG